MSWTPTRSDASEVFDRFFASLTAQLSGAGETQLKAEIANTFQAFCRETNVWRERIERNLIAGKATYELSSESGCADVVWVISVFVDGRYYNPLGGDASRTENRYGAYEVLDDYKTIRMSPPFSRTVAKGMKAVVSLAPKNGSLDLPDAVIQQYFEPLRDGVLERMYGHSSRPYSNPDKSLQHQRKFHAAVTRVRRDVRGGNAQSSPAWNFPTQARGGTRRGARSYGY